MISDNQNGLLVPCALRVAGVSLDRQLLARVAQRDRGLDLLYRGDIPERSAAAQRTLPLLDQALTDEGAVAGARERVEQELRAAAEVGARVVTVLDEDYPANLRLVPNLPPFLFVLGHLQVQDARSVAVVGTRRASQDGMFQAGSLARQLVERGVTVTSGLARGIDTAAHTETLRHGN